MPQLAELRLMVSAWKASTAHRSRNHHPTQATVRRMTSLSREDGVLPAQAALNHIDQLNARFIFRDSFDAGARQSLHFRT